MKWPSLSLVVFSHLEIYFVWFNISTPLQLYFRKYYYGITPHLFTFNVSASVFEVGFLKRICMLSLLFHAVCKSLECLDHLHLTWLWTWLGLNLPPCFLFSHLFLILFLISFYALFCISWVFFNISILSLINYFLYL